MSEIEKGKKVKSTYMYQEPSAPSLPFTSCQNIRVTQPIGVVSDIALGAFALAEAIPNVLHTNESDEIRGAGKDESRQVNKKILTGSADGYKLVHDESSTTSSSNHTGVSHHQQLQQKIRQGNTDNVHRLGASQPIAVAVSLDNLDEQSQIPANKVPTAPAAPGYQFADYTSTYESGGGYKCEEYKSIYDK